MGVHCTCVPCDQLRASFPLAHWTRTATPLRIRYPRPGENAPLSNGMRTLHTKQERRLATLEFHVVSFCFSTT